MTKRKVACPHCGREVDRDTYLRAIRWGRPSAIRRGLVCPLCQEVKDHEEPKDKTFDDKLQNGFRLLKGDCDETNDYHFVGVSSELTDKPRQYVSTGKKRYNTPTLNRSNNG